MPRPVKEVESGPPPTAVPWLATPNGRYYDHEREVGESVEARRKTGVVVHAQTAYDARQKASRELGLSPEHIDLKQQEEKAPMSNSYLQFSECLTLKGAKERKWFERYMTASDMSNPDHWDDESLPLTEEAKFWGPVLSESEDDSPRFEWKIVEKPLHIWFHVDDQGNVDHIAKLVQHFFKEMRPEGRDGFTISWAETCSKMEAGQFGGGACLITKDEIHWLNTWQWLTDLCEHLKVG